MDFFGSFGILDWEMVCLVLDFFVFFVFLELADGVFSFGIWGIWGIFEIESVTSAVVFWNTLDLWNFMIFGSCKMCLKPPRKVGHGYSLSLYIYICVCIYIHSIYIYIFFFNTVCLVRTYAHTHA